TPSGRTDAGVHAKGQVVSFDWPVAVPLDCYALKGALNGITPRQIAILEVYPVAPEFHARFSARRKCYEYRILNRLAPHTNLQYPAWHVPSRLDWKTMQAIACLYRGTHDFDAFKASDANQKTSVRTIYVSELTKVADNEIVYTVIGGGFLKQMVRIMVGTMVDAGMGLLSIENVSQLLENNSQRKMAGKTAPGRGLTLNWVSYD
ncbi:UNVERIFIED_CONTAM: hypothetical protein GTU68_005013, partial [Idotea baltica]|nr:hypothetical protein [Idotea baltica]